MTRTPSAGTGWTPAPVPWRALIAVIGRRTPEGIVMRHPGGDETVTPVTGAWPRPVRMIPTRPHPAGIPIVGEVTASWVDVTGGGGLGVYAEGTAFGALALHLRAQRVMAARADVDGTVALVQARDGLTDIVLTGWKLLSVVVRPPDTTAPGECRMWLIPTDTWTDADPADHDLKETIL